MVMLEAGEVLGGGGRRISQQIGMSFLDSKYCCCCCCQEHQMTNRSLGVAHDWYDNAVFRYSCRSDGEMILFLDEEDDR